MNLLTTPIRDDSLLHWSTHATRNNPYNQTLLRDEGASYGDYA